MRRSRMQGLVVSDRGDSIGILSFEVASLMVKVARLWRSLSVDDLIHRLRRESIRLHGVLVLVSHDVNFLLHLALAEILDSLARSVARLGATRCSHPALRRFDASFSHLLSTGADPNGLQYALVAKMDRKANKMQRLAAATDSLYRETDVLACLERKGSEQIRIAMQKRQVKSLRKSSLWGRTFDYAVRLLGRSLCTILARIIHVVHSSAEGTGAIRDDQCMSRGCVPPARLKRSVSQRHDVAGPGRIWAGLSRFGLFDAELKRLKPPASTLGAAELALHYANLILEIEKLAVSANSIDPRVRDGLYSMVTTRIRACLRARLTRRGSAHCDDPVGADEWRDRLSKILEWLVPLARNMIKWQLQNSFEQRDSASAAPSVLLLQTLYFADQVKTEDVITQLLVGLDYLWRFERGINPEALILQRPSSRKGHGYLDSMRRRRHPFTSSDDSDSYFSYRNP